jgi:hypothetical protein
MEAMDDVFAASVKAPSGSGRRKLYRASLCAVGLWDDFTVRLFSLDSAELVEVLQIHLSTEDDESEITDGSSRSTMKQKQHDGQVLVSHNAGFLLLSWI